MSDPLTTVYATDEQIAVRAPDDFAEIVPASQRLAYGTDGAFSPSDLWTLTSTLTDFAAAGVQTGNVVRLEKVNVFQPAGELFGVASVSGHSLTLRRLGTVSGGPVGAPPSPAAGATGVKFTVETLWPQIENASFRLNRTYSIDAGLPQRAPTQLYDLRDLREACELTVLAERYRFATRSDGDFKTKFGAVIAALSDVTARLSVRWAPAVNNTQPPTSTWFSTKLSR